MIGLEEEEEMIQLPNEWIKDIKGTREEESLLGAQLTFQSMAMEVVEDDSLENQNIQPTGEDVERAMG